MGLVVFLSRAIGTLARLMAGLSRVGSSALPFTGLSVSPLHGGSVAVAYRLSVYRLCPFNCGGEQ